MGADTSNAAYYADDWEHVEVQRQAMRAENINRQLLVALRNLLEHPRGDIQEPQQHIPGLLQLETYDDFFDRGISCPPEASQRTQVRFRELRKHGNCRTRKALIVRPEKYDNGSDLSASEWETLLKPLLHNPKLEELYINTCRSIDPAVKDKIYSIAGELLRTSRSLQFLFLEMGGISAANVARLARGQQGNWESNLDALIIINKPDASVMKHIWEMIERAPKLRHLWLKTIGALDDGGVRDWSEALRRSTSLVRLTLEGLELDGGVPELLSKAFTEAHANRSVKELELIGIGGAPGDWKPFFESLRLNSTVGGLELRDCKSLENDEAFGNLMQLLHVNSSLRSVQNYSALSWKKDGKEASIVGLLKRNAERRSFYSVLREADLPFVSAKAGGLFLCGSPHAGKTRLRTTMLKALKKQSSAKTVSNELLSTKGIEVESLQDDNNMQISIWDLSGQWIYRSLQDLFLPPRSQARVYVYVFSAYETQGSEKKMRQRKQHLSSDLKTELEFWLRLIAANTHAAEPNLPNVLVVITHADMLEQDEKDMDWAANVVHDLQKVFDGILNICTDIHLINAKDDADVTQVTERVLPLFETLLQRETHIVPEACADLASIIAKLRLNLPVWRRSRFYDFCVKESGVEALGEFRPEDSAGSKVLEAVSLCLHDVGAIFLVPDSDLVVVDPNWLMNSFLGELIGRGHEYHEQDGTNGLSPDGFMDVQSLRSILRTLVTENFNEDQVNASILEELLLKLDLCYLVQGGKSSGRFFIPTLVGRKKDSTPSRRNLMWKCQEGVGDQCFGYRVQCINRERTLLPASFFPRFQIFLLHKVMRDLQMIDNNVLCGRGFLEFRQNGHEVLLESDGDGGDHIDIMARTTSDPETAKKFIADNIIEEMRALCASTSPGVSLSVGILPTDYVNQFNST